MENSVSTTVLADKEAERLKEISKEYQDRPINWMVKVEDSVSGIERIFHIHKDREEELWIIFTLSNYHLEYYIAAGRLQSDHVYTGNRIYKVKAFYENRPGGVIEFTITRSRYYLLEELFEPLLTGSSEKLIKDIGYLKGKTADQMYSKFMESRKKLKQERDAPDKKDSEKENRALAWHTSRLAYEGLKFSDALKLYQNSDYEIKSDIYAECEPKKVASDKSQNNEAFLNSLKEMVIDGLSTEEDGSIDNDARKAIKLMVEKGDPISKTEKEKYLKLQQKRRSALVSFFDNQALHTHAAAIAQILNKRSQNKYTDCGIVIKRSHIGKKKKKRCKS